MHKLLETVELFNNENIPKNLRYRDTKNDINNLIYIIDFNL